MQTDHPTVAPFDKVNVLRLAGSLAKSARSARSRVAPALTAIGFLETRERGGPARRAVGFFRRQDQLVEIASDAPDAPIDLGSTEAGFLLGTPLRGKLVPLRTIRAALARDGFAPPALQKRGAFAAHFLVGSFPGTDLDAAGRAAPAWISFYGDGRTTLMAVHSAQSARLLQLVTLPALAMPIGINPTLGWAFLLKLLLLVAAVVGLGLLIAAIGSNPGMLVLGIAAKWAVLLLVLAIITQILALLLEMFQTNPIANAQQIARIKNLLARLQQLERRAKQKKAAGQQPPTQQDIDEAKAALDEAREIFEDVSDDLEDEERSDFEDAFNKAQEALDKLR